MKRFFRDLLFNGMKSVLHRNGFSIIKWKASEEKPPSSDLPEGAERYLQSNNPKLLELMEAYGTLDRDLTNSNVWTWNSGGLNSTILQNFRGDHKYVWQLRGLDVPELRYLASTYYQLSHDKLSLLSKFRDDALFGNHLFEMAGRLVSREILDTANEINFLERELKLSAIKNLKVLDIGAGYGRVAHRSSEAFPNLEKYYCTDGIPSSAFLCDYYLRFRGVTNAEVVPMPVIRERLTGEKIQLAVNIHSFSECSLSAIEWWIKLVSDLKISHLLIIPNAYKDLGARLLTNQRVDFSYIPKKYNYELIKKEPKYNDPLMQKLGLYPSYYYLFRNTAS